MKLCAVKDCEGKAIESGTLTLEDTATGDTHECEVPLCADHAEEAVSLDGFNFTLDYERIPAGITTWALRVQGEDADITEAQDNDA